MINFSEIESDLKDNTTQDAISIDNLGILNNLDKRLENHSINRNMISEDYIEEICAPPRFYRNT